jgi:hypothetical protein
MLVREGHKGFRSQWPKSGFEDVSLGKRVTRRSAQAENADERRLQKSQSTATVVWLRCRTSYLIVAAPTLHTTSSCEPVAPEQPMAPMSFPPSMSGIPPREAITPSSVSV